MDAAQALADLTEISAQIEAAVIADAEGTPLAATPASEHAAAALARTGVDLLLGAGDGATQVEVATGDGSVFVVREGERLVAAVARAEAPSGLVLYDLRTCLRRLAEPEAERPKPRRSRKRKVADEGDEAG